MADDMPDLWTFDAEARRAALMRRAHACQIGLCGFVLALAVDFAMVPQRIGAMATARGVVSLALLGLLVASKRPPPAIGPEVLSLAFLMTVGMGLIACAVVSGADTGYHDTLAVVFLASAVFLSGRVIPMSVVMAGLSLVYAVAMVIFGTVPSTPEIVNDTFLLAIAAGVAAVFIYGAGVLKSRERQASKREWEANRRLRATVEELDAAYGRLKELDRAKNHFFANINHELRTPLMLLLATIESQKEEAELAGVSSYQFELSWRNGLRLLRLVDDLLELTKLESSAVKLSPQNTDAAKIARDLVQDMQPIANRKSVTLVYTGLSEALMRVDPSGIERVINNLVSNALKFTPEGGKIAVDMTATGTDTITLAVTDTGVGIPDAEKNRLFERFYQGDSGKRIKQGGVGIGLSMCKRIVELHGGTISVRSKLGEGTTLAVVIARNPQFAPGVVTDEIFVAPPSRQAGLAEWDHHIRQEKDYRLSAVREAGERRVVPRASQGADKHASVLIIDDNRDMVNLLAGALSDEHNVYIAGNGQEGLALAKRFRPDVIISDVTMPVMDGFTLLAKVREDGQLHDTPVVLMTLRGKSSDAFTSDVLEADAFLPKPFSYKQVRAVVRRLLRRQHSLAVQATSASQMSTKIAAAGLAHDILNPVGFIRSAAYLINRSHQTLIDAQSPQEKRNAASATLQRALRSANTGIERIVECVELLRLAADGQASAVEPLDVNYIIERTLVVTSATVVPRTTLDAQKRALVQRGQVDRVLLNLILNAIEAGGPQCNIHVASSDLVQEGMVRVRVTDDGPGISGELIHQVTEPYYSTKNRGSGLGLAMCRHIIETNGGKFTINSELGRGSEFTVDLPAEPGIAEPSLPISSAQ